MNKISKKTLFTILITFAVTYLLTSAFRPQFADFKRLERIMQIIDEQYVGDYSREKCEEAAINAVLGSIDDKYAVYYDEENAKETMQNIEGYYYGIGVEVFANTQKNAIEILSVHASSPAEKAGIMQGDLLLSIDGKDYGADGLADAVSYIKGDGTKASLGKTIDIVLSRGSEKIPVTLKRAKLGLYAVKSEMLDDICYIRYDGFTQKSLSDFKKIVNSLDEKKVKGLVIDIRYNPGGEFSSVIEMCDLFLDEEPIMYTIDKKGDKTVYTGTKGKKTFPMAVIVSGSSASASEVFAGAMQANKRAVIIGEETFGKGVTQSVMYLDRVDKSMGAVKLTTYKNYTPDGRWINEKIIPDIKVEIDKIGSNIREDAAFKAAVDYFNKEN